MNIVVFPFAGKRKKRAEMRRKGAADTRERRQRRRGKRGRRRQKRRGKRGKRRQRKRGKRGRSIHTGTLTFLMIENKIRLF